MTEPTIADIDHCIETIERTHRKWSGSAGYRRFLETELFCLREVRRRINCCQETRDAVARAREKRLAEVIEQKEALRNWINETHATWIAGDLDPQHMSRGLSLANQTAPRG